MSCPKHPASQINKNGSCRACNALIGAENFYKNLPKNLCEKHPNHRAMRDGRCKCCVDNEKSRRKKKARYERGWVREGKMCPNHKMSYLTLDGRCHQCEYKERRSIENKRILEENIKNNPCKIHIGVKTIDGECRKCRSSRIGKEYNKNNKERIKNFNKKWKENTPPEVKRAKSMKDSLRRKYGITIEDYNKMVSEQNNVCAICNRPETRKDIGSDKPARLCVDHCHTTGKIRKLLCSACNCVLGHGEDNPEIFYKMAKYLENFKISSPTL